MTFTAKGPVDGDSPVDRAELIARLAAQIAATQSRPADAGIAGVGSAAAAGATASPSAHAGPAPETPSASSAPGAADGARGRGGAGHRARSDPGPTSPGSAEDPPGDPAVLAKAICLRLLAISARPRAGLKAALTRKGIPDEVAESVLDRLTRAGLVDDEAYAAAFVRTKHRDRALGRAGLGQELRRKGVDPELVTAAVSEIDPEAERVRARALVQRRLDAAMAAGPVAARRRLAGLLARRGYAPAVAYEIVGEAVDAYVQASPPTEAEDPGGWSPPDDLVDDAG